MKKTLFVLATLLSQLTLAGTTPTQEEINTKALSILLKNANDFLVDYNYTEKLDDVPLAKDLAESFITPKNAKTLIENSCSFDKNDEAFKCTLRIEHTGSEESELSIFYKYQLEKGTGNLPSEKPFLLTVFKDIAG